MKLKSLKAALFLIVILAAVVRFTGLSHLPPALNRDEAAIGYNAYSLLKTGKDEHGQFMPFAFLSIGDYKMPLYIYLTILPVAVFGLNEFSVRFWSALAGTLAVIAIFYLTKILLKPSSLKPKQISLAALISSLFVAFNPWSIFYSRISFEANVSLTMFLFGLWLVFKGFKKTLYLYPGLALFLLAFLTYNSSYIFIPLFIIPFVLIWRKQLLKGSKILPLILFALTAGLILKGLWAVSVQKSQITIFNDPTIIHNYNQARTQVYQHNPLLARTWWNKKVFYTRLFVNNYLKSFSPKFLVIEGGMHPWHRNPGVGSFYYLEAVLAVIGLVWLITRPKLWPVKLTLLAWLLLAPLTSAITIDAPHSTRSLHLLPVVVLLASFGFIYLYQKIKQPYFWLLLTLIYLTNFAYAGYRYLIYYPPSIIHTIPLGLRESLEYVYSTSFKGKVYLTNPHISTYLYPLFYGRFDPAQFQQTALWTKPDPSGMKDAYQYGRYTILDYAGEVPPENAMVIVHQHVDYDRPYSQVVFTSGYYKVYFFH